MKPNTDRPKAPESKPGSKPVANDDLKSLPMPELEAKLGSSTGGLSQAEAQNLLTQYGTNEIEEKETNPFLKCLTYDAFIEGRILILAPKLAGEIVGVTKRAD
jgi:H+-transporting ATPase